MLSRISFGVINKLKIDKSSTLVLKTNNNNNKFIINQFQLLNNTNKNNINQFGKRSFCSSSKPEPPKNESKLFNLMSGKTYSKFYNKDKGTFSLSNHFLLIFGISCIAFSLPAFIMYFFGNDGTLDDVEVFKLMNYYFNFYFPFRIVDQKGYIKNMVERYKDNTISEMDFRSIEGMITNPSLDHIDYLEKYGFSKAVFDKILEKKGHLNKNDKEMYLVLLMMMTGRSVPDEVLKKTDFESTFKDNTTQNRNILMEYGSKAKSMFEINKTDLLISALVAAPITSYLAFRFKLPMMYVFRSMSRSSFVTAALISTPLINKAFQSFSLSKSNEIGQHIIATRVANIAFGSFLIYLSTLPFITVLAPISLTLFITKSISLLLFTRELRAKAKEIKETKIKE
ncbi:hypothetical protein DICPUDRAFT_152582 [Dictyostelium purpureum]|uniref:Uncharacterized protein n=1 Tax=Dictyostelium purpureum TaxID=5786 RepID=F0ZLR6_DICPU|nr:uncharacterized protein DICPUDRAFT_152582 [Dictyostelium purpureum]EGC35116.1 hypothetical protein DICPUDRAFT_152582 [Dictyostelium purpureum]|eukprot:XP_003288368.1 hypothetical protein DICPUDRAFT_152582 [Dictyostelium purpureum]